MRTEAARRYAAACVDTRKAWHATPMLSRARVAQVRWVRRVLCDAAAPEIASMLGDLCGPMYPGEQVFSEGSASSGKGVALALQVLDAVLPACVEERDRSAARTAPGREGQAARMLDVDQLKSLLLHWIDLGCLPAPLDVRHPQARRIAEFLRQQGARHSEEESQAMLRLACIAVTAPAVESALVMTRLSEGYLRVMDAAAPPAPVAQPDYARSAMARNDRDDEIARSAFDNLAQAALRQAGEGRGG